MDRVPLLERLLQSIVHQVRPDVEVVVADNGSTDGTGALVRRVRSFLPRLIYSRASRNEGFDANIRRAVSHATGTMCWLIGDDDELYPGAVARVLDTIQNCPGAMIVGDMHQRFRDGTLVYSAPTDSTNWPDYSVWWLDRPGAVAEYLDGAASVYASFPALSTVIFPRYAWPTDMRRWEGTSYTHYFAAWQMVLAGIPLVVRRKPIIWTANGNHNQRDAETLATLRHTVETLVRLGTLFNTPSDRRAVRQVWNLAYTAERRASFEARCCHEPSWEFVKRGLAYVLDEPEPESRL